jgi:hypothetical protein
MKRMLAALLAVTAMMSITTLASAADGDEPDAAKGMSVMDVTLSGSPVERETEVWNGSPYNDYAGSGTLSGYLAIKSGTEITVKNIGTDQSQYVYVYLGMYEMLTEPLERSEYDDETGIETPFTLNNVYYDGGGYYYLSDLQTDDEALTSSGSDLYWNWTPYYDGYEAAANGLTLSSGESVTFRLPERDGDPIYRLYVEAYYPQYDWYCWRSVDLMFDDVNADKDVQQAFTKVFSDVSFDSYYYAPVEWAVKESITTGTSNLNFSPNDTCTQAQIITFLWRANGFPVYAAPEDADEQFVLNPFKAVTETDYFYKAVIWAYHNGIIDDTFSPNSPCTRATAVTYMYNNDGKPSEKYNGAFRDVSTGATYASAVQWALDRGVTTGTSATAFSPDEICTRAQIVTFLYRGLGE